MNKKMNIKFCLFKFPTLLTAFLSLVFINGAWAMDSKIEKESKDNKTQLCFLARRQKKCYQISLDSNITICRPSRQNNALRRHRNSKRSV